MSKTILVKKQTDEQPVRRCKNCGKDIGDKKKGAQFCCKQCWTSYNQEGKFYRRLLDY